MFGARASPPWSSLPIDAIVHSRAWKAQVPYLAPDVTGSHHRPARATAGLTGRSRPAAYADTEFVADTIAVMDAAGIDRGRARWYVLQRLARRC